MWKPQFSLAVVFAIMAATASPGAAQSSSAVEEFKTLEIWRSAGDLMSSDGTWLTEDLPHTVRKRRELIESRVVAARRGTPAGKCIEVGIIVDPPPGVNAHPQSLTAAVRDASAVLTGTVSWTNPGFAWDAPGILVEISVDRWLRKPGLDAAPGSVYVFYPGGEVQLGPASVCRVSALPPPPIVGSRVLLLPQIAPVVASPMLFALLPSGADYFGESPDGSVVASGEVLPLIEPQQAAGFETFVEAVARLVSAGTGEQVR